MKAIPVCNIAQGPETGRAPPPHRSKLRNVRFRHHRLTAEAATEGRKRFADDLLPMLWLARSGPPNVAPTMNGQMLEKAATQRDVGRPCADGVRVVESDSGGQACSE